MANIIAGTITTILLVGSLDNLFAMSPSHTATDTQPIHDRAVLLVDSPLCQALSCVLSYLDHIALCNLAQVSHTTHKLIAQHDAAQLILKKKAVIYFFKRYFGEKLTDDNFGNFDFSCLLRSEL